MAVVERYLDQPKSKLTRGLEPFDPFSCASLTLNAIRWLKVRLNWDMDANSNKSVSQAKRSGLWEGWHGQAADK